MDALSRMLCAVVRGVPSTKLGHDWSLDEWGRFVVAAKVHGISALLQRAFSAGGWPAAMPEPVRNTLRTQVYEAAGHNLRVYQAVKAILAAVGTDTPLVVLKGAALGSYLYQAPHLRPLSDADLLVRPEALDSVARVVRGLGYRHKPLIAPELVHALEPHLSLIGGHGETVPVEIHWSLLAGSADWRHASVEWFWRQTEPWLPPAGDGPGALQLTPTASLLYQCAHLVLRHGQDPPRLIWLYDLHLLASSGRVQWQELIAQADDLRWGAVVVTALEQAQTCFDTPLDPDCIEVLRGPLDRRVRFRGVDPRNYRPYTTLDSLAELDAPTRLRMLLRIVFPSRAYLREQYEPRWGAWWPLAYPYRWLKPFRMLAARLTSHDGQKPRPSRDP